MGSQRHNFRHAAHNHHEAQRRAAALAAFEYAAAQAAREITDDEDTADALRSVIEADGATP